MEDSVLIDHARGMCFDTATALYDIARRDGMDAELVQRLKDLEHELQTVAELLAHAKAPPNT